MAPTAEALITFKNLQCANLMDADRGAGTSDPFVHITWGGPSALVTRVIYNNENPVWPGEYTAHVASVGELTMRIQVADFDQEAHNDLLGETTIVLSDLLTEQVHNVRRGLALHGRDVRDRNGRTSEIAFTVEIEPLSSSRGGDGGVERPERKLPGLIVQRKEIRFVGHGEQWRFVRAVRRMMEGGEGSEYARIAGYHGFPGSYCAHDAETFPGWHRAYTVEFEKALQRADASLGNDGRIGLPYWDFTVPRGPEGDYFPRVLLEAFHERDGGRSLVRSMISREAVMRDPRGVIRQHGERFWHDGYAPMRVDDNELWHALRSSGKEINEAMFVEEHFRASHGYDRHSLEAPHGSVHHLLGFPMSSEYFRRRGSHTTQRSPPHSYTLHCLLSPLPTLF